MNSSQNIINNQFHLFALHSTGLLGISLSNGNESANQTASQPTSNLESKEKYTS